MMAPHWADLVVALTLLMMQIAEALQGQSLVLVLAELALTIAMGVDRMVPVWAPGRDT